MKFNTRLFLLLATGLLLCPVVAPQPVPGGPPRAERILTVEEWFQSAATVWVVTPDKLTIFRKYDFVGRSDESLAELRLSPSEIELIKTAIKTIPQDAYGFAHQDERFLHGPVLRLVFSGDGSSSQKVIELHSIVTPWEENVANAISRLVPDTMRISFAKLVENYNHDMAQDPGAVRFVKRPLK